MTKATGKKVEKAKRANNENEVLFGVARKDIKETVDFGSFEVLMCKGGALFRTHTGFHIWTAPWVMTMEGKSETNNLYQWLLNLVEMKHETEEHPDEAFPEVDNGATYSDVLEGMVLLTIANLMHPVTAFIDVDEATKFAKQRLDWLTEMSARLEEAAAEVKEETEEDLRKNFEHGQNAIATEQIGKMLEKEFEEEEGN